MTDVVVVNDDVYVAVEEPASYWINVGEQGPAGPPGPPGPTGGLAVQYIAAIALGGHRIVVLNATQQVEYADNTVVAHADKVLGMTTGAASAGALATIQVGGELTEPSWSWTAEAPLYLGANGQVTQSPPASGFVLNLGFAISATKIFLDLKQPILL